MKKNIYCRRQGNTKLYKLKIDKPIHKYEFLIIRCLFSVILGKETASAPRG